MNWKFDFSPDTSADHGVRKFDQKVSTYTGLGLTLLKDLHMMGDALDVDKVEYLRAGLDFTIGRVGL